MSGEVVEFPEVAGTKSVVACSCGNTSFRLLSDQAVPRCLECGALQPYYMAVIPEWIRELINKG